MDSHGKYMYFPIKKKPKKSNWTVQVILTNKSDLSEQYSGGYFIQIEARTQDCVKFLLWAANIIVIFDMHLWGCHKQD